MISPFILKGLGDLLSNKIDFITNITHNAKQYFIVIGSGKIFLIDNEFEKLQAQINFNSIDRIIVSINDPNLFQMHMNEKKSKNIPAKMNIHCLDRRHLVNYIRFGWKTDYMFKHLEVRDMPIFKAMFQDTLNVTQLPKGPNLVLMLPTQGQGYQKIIQGGYQYFLKQDFTSKKQQEGVFFHNQNSTCKLSIQITEDLPLEILKSLGDRIDLQYYAETFLEAILVAESKKDLLEEKEGKKDKKGKSEKKNQEENNQQDQQMDNQEEEEEEEIQGDYWIVQSNLYKKRQNLNMDPAEWTGWEVQAKTKKREIFIILLRRKYLPPLMENYNEIAFVLYGPQNFASLEPVEEQDQPLESQQQNQQQEDEEEDEEKDGNEDEDDEEGTKQNNDQENFQKALKIYQEECILANILRNIVDTVQTTRNVLEQYTKIIQQNLNALIYDEETTLFLHNKLGITPCYIIFGIHILRTLFEQLEMTDQGPKYSYLKKLLEDTYSREINKKDNQDLLTEDVLKIQDLSLLIDKFQQLTFVKEKKGEEIERQRTWNYKLSRYLAYCIDGGLLGKAFQLKDFLDVPNFQNNYEKMLDYFLYAIPEGNASSDFSMGLLSTRFQKMVSQRYIFNERVMSVLLEEKYFSNDLIKRETPQLYADVLVSLLLHTKNTVIKINVCKHIVQYQAELKRNSSITDTLINTFKSLISPLLVTYQSPNRILSTMACIALFNLCTNSKEYKYIIMKEDGGNYLLNKLNQKDQNLLNYTLRLIYNLMSIVQHIEKFISMGIMVKVQNILKGTGIKNCFYSAKTLIISCQILRICLSGDNEIQNMQSLVQNTRKVLIYQADQYILDTFEIDQLKSEAIQVISKLCQKSTDIKLLVNEKVIPYVLELIAEEELDTNLYEKIIYLMCILIRDKKEWGKEWKSKQTRLVTILQQCERDGISNASYLLAQLVEIQKK